MFVILEFSYYLVMILSDCKLEKFILFGNDFNWLLEQENVCNTGKFILFGNDFNWL